MKKSVKAWEKEHARLLAEYNRCESRSRKAQVAIRKHRESMPVSDKGTR